MRATPEVKVKKVIDKLLAEFIPACWWHKAVVNGMGKPTLDYTGLCAGAFFAIEAKAPGKVPTKRQADTAKDIRKARGAVFVIDNEHSPVLDELREWLTWQVLSYVG